MGSCRLRITSIQEAIVLSVARRVKCPKSRGLFSLPLPPSPPPPPPSLLLSPLSLARRRGRVPRRGFGALTRAACSLRGTVDDAVRRRCLSPSLSLSPPPSPLPPRLPSLRLLLVPLPPPLPPPRNCLCPAHRLIVSPLARVCALSAPSPPLALVFGACIVSSPSALALLPEGLDLPRMCPQHADSVRTLSALCDPQISAAIPPICHATCRVPPARWFRGSAKHVAVGRVVAPSCLAALSCLCPPPRARSASARPLSGCAQPQYEHCADPPVAQATALNGATFVGCIPQSAQADSVTRCAVGRDTSVCRNAYCGDLPAPHTNMHHLPVISASALPATTPVRHPGEARPASGTDPVTAHQLQHLVMLRDELPLGDRPLHQHGPTRYTRAVRWLRRLEIAAALLRRILEQRAGSAPSARPAPLRSGGACFGAANAIPSSRSTLRCQFIPLASNRAHHSSPISY